MFCWNFIYALIFKINLILCKKYALFFLFHVFEYKNSSIYFEEFENVEDAFKRELKLKAGNRKKKEELINSMNPEWGDISINWLDDNFKFQNKK